MTIEKVTETDAEELLAIYAPYVEKTAITFEYEVPTLDEFRERIRNISVKYPYLKAVVDGRTCGYAYAGAFHERAAYAWSVETTVYVRENARGQGIGRALYTGLEQELKAQGFLNMNACIAKPKEESPFLTDASIRFHKALGFSEVGTFHDSGFKFGRWFDMIWMEKMLGTHDENPPEILKP